MSLYVPGGAPALEAPRSYSSKPITSVSYQGNTTVTGTPTPDSPATLTPLRVPDVLGAAKQVGELWSLPNGTKDTYDGEAGLLVRRVGKYEIKGTEPFSDLTELTNVIRFLVRPSNLVAKKEDASSTSTHFTKIYSWDIDNEHFYINGYTITFFLPKNLVSAITLDTAKAWFAAQAAAGTPVTILYALAQPTVEHIVYTGRIATRSTDILAPSWTGKTTVTGTPSPDNPATITGVPFAATATGQDGLSRSMDLGITGYSLPDGTADSYDGKNGDLVQRVWKIVLSETNVESYNSDNPSKTNIWFNISFSGQRMFTSHRLNMTCSHFKNQSGWNNDTENNEGVYGLGDFGLSAYPIGFTIRKSRLTAYGLVDGTTSTYVPAIKAWLAAQTAAGTPVIILYEPEKPIVYNHKADITAFEGQTTVTGADAVEVIEGRVLRVADCLPFEIVRSNRNLADNPFFKINQRGQTQYTASGHCVDRFKITADIGNPTLTVETSGVLLHGTENTVTIYQLYEASDFRYGNIYTFSAFKEYGEFISIESFDLTTGKVLAKEYNGDGNIIFVSFIAPENSSIYFTLKTKSNTKIACIKKEIGPTQTLARKIGDQWVLNDPPPDPTLELLKCQKYLKIFAMYEAFVVCDVAQDNIDFIVPTGVKMQGTPKLFGNGVGGMGKADGWNYSVVSNGTCSMRVRATKQNHGTTRNYVFVVDNESGLTAEL